MNQKMDEDIPTNKGKELAVCRVSNGMRKKADMMTLQDILELFNLPRLLQDLDDRIDMVRKHRATKEEHEQYLKEVDKAMQKLSLMYHPDKVKGSGVFDEEIAKAHDFQIALNTTRAVLKVLNQSFLQDLDIDYKYQFYAKMEISSLGNEEEIKKLNLRVLHKLVMLSEIKQRRIIASINKFLKASRHCLDNFTEGNRDGFIKNREDALLCLNMCISGYKRLVKEFEEVKKDCEEDGTLESMSSLICKMEDEMVTHLNTLEELKKHVKDSLTGRLSYYKAYLNQDVDKYFVLPFIEYVNNIMMCNSVLFSNIKEMKTKGLKSYLASLSTTFLNTIYKYFMPELHEDINYGVDNYMEKNKSTKNQGVYKENLEKKEKKSLKANKKKEMSHMYNSSSDLRDKADNNSRPEIEQLVDAMLMLKVKLERTFNPDDYVEGGTKKYIMQEYIKWTKVMDGILKRQEDLLAETRAYIETTKAEKIRLGETCNKVVEDNVKLGEKCDRAIEDNRKLIQEINDIMKIYKKHEVPIWDEASNSKACISQQNDNGQANEH